MLIIPVFAGDCDGDPGVGALDIVPPLIYVRPQGATPTTFRLEARLWTNHDADRKGVAPTDVQAISWSSNKSWLNVKNSQGSFATLELNPGYSTADAEAAVTASVGGVTSEPSARVVVLTDGTAPTLDTLRSDFDPDVAPNVAVVAGARAERADCAESLFAFVRTVPLGHLNDVCGIAAADAGNAGVLSTSRAASVWSETWTSLNDGVRAVQTTPRSLPIAVWIAVQDDAVDPQLVHGFAQDEIREANAILSMSRAGITLDTVGPIQTVTDPSALSTIGVNCWDADAIAASSNIKGVLNIYYVAALPLSLRGLECGRHEGRSHPVIYLGWYNRASITLLHEVGHALSLTLPGLGHPVDEGHVIVAGFDPTNVMTGFLDPLDARGRDRFTIGQAFRMNVDSASWLNFATKGGVNVREPEALRSGCQCQVGAASPCPRLGDDAATPSSAPGRFEGWMCYDEVDLIGPSLASDAPVALLAGRRWRASPGTCSQDLSGIGEDRWDETRIYFKDNLTRPGSCPSWVAIFFRTHAPLYLPVPESPEGWVDVRDEVRAWDRPMDGWSVPVHVWYKTQGPAGDKLLHLAENDLAEAAKAFSPDNRSGLTFVPTWHRLTGAIPNTNVCSVPAHHADDSINVYYMPSLNGVTGTTDGARCHTGGTDVIVIHTAAKHTVSALGHFLGSALGLLNATTANGFAPDQLTGNLMRPSPADRGSTLTAGQVFRVHFNTSSWLNRSTSSLRRMSAADAAPVFDCDGVEQNSCPRPGAVVSPDD